MPLKPYQQEFARFLAETGSLFFQPGLTLKDGRPTPYFVNFGKLCTGKSSFLLGSFFARQLIDLGRLPAVDIIVGPSYKGSAIAQAAALYLWREEGREVLFDYDRKEFKTYGEASGQKNLWVNNTLFDQCGLWMVDDVLTTMATKYELLDKIHQAAKQQKITVRLLGLSVGIDRQQTTACYDAQGRVILGRKGENAVKQFTERTGVPVYAIAPITEVVDFLFRERIPVWVNGIRQPLSQEVKQSFDDYIKEYGLI